MEWRRIDLHGAASIARTVNVYEIQDLRGSPWSKYKIKVLERGENDFIAVPNVCTKTEDGTPDWIAGLGQTEAEALQDVVRRFGEVISSRKTWQPADFEWSDPNDF